MSTKPSNAQDNLRILKKSNCPSLSGTTTLTYHLGIDYEEAIFIRLYDNSGGGFFSDEWISFVAIQQALNKWPKGVPITSHCFHPLFKGKSVNTPAFLAAVLRHEKLLRAIEGRQRTHAVLAPDAFLEPVKKLASTNTTSRKRATSTKK